MTMKIANDQTYQTFIATKGVTLVDVGAQWCPPCKALLPILDQLEAEWKEAVSIIKIDADESPDAASAFGVMSMPTVIILKDGIPVDKLVGLRPKEVYNNLISKYQAS